VFTANWAKLTEDFVIPFLHAIKFDDPDFTKITKTTMKKTPGRRTTMKKEKDDEASDCVKK